MSTNFGPKQDKSNLNKLNVSELACLSKTIIKKDLTVCGDLTVKGDICFENEAKILRVPTDFPTLNAALAEVFYGSKLKKFRIVLETQGPHILPPQQLNGRIDYLSIEAASKAPNMGSYYGQDAGLFNTLGIKTDPDVLAADVGGGPYNLALSNADTTVTVTGNSVMGPGYFGGPLIPYPTVFVGHGGFTPNFNQLVPGDKVRWFKTATNAVTELTIASVLNNVITFTSVVPTPVERGDGFAVKPRATVRIGGPAPLSPEIIVDGVIKLDGLFFESNPAVLNPPNPEIGPFYAFLMVEGNYYSELKQCLSESIIASGSMTMRAYQPNTFMDPTNGLIDAKLLCNAGGVINAFKQTFVGPSAGFETFNANCCTMCFSTFIKCNNAVTHRDGGAKHDFNDFVKCSTAIFAEGGGHPSQACFIWYCQNAIKLRNNSMYNNVPPKAAGFQDLPLIIQGDPLSVTNVGFDLDDGSRVNSRIIRMCDTSKHAVVDGVNIHPFANVVATTTRQPAPTGVGVRVSGIVYDNFNGDPC